MEQPSPHREDAVRSLIRCVGSITVLFVAYAVLPLKGDRWWLGALIGLAVIAAIFPLAIHRLRKVLSSERPIFEAVEAVVLLLALLVTGFASLYYALNHDEQQIAGLVTRVDAIYFTITTLSTVGFGDVHAVSQIARVAVTVQIVIGMLFVGVVVRVFTGAVRQRTGDRTIE